MNNVLSSMQMLKSSEIKNKFSKSVSYETLVIGAATIGRECGEAPEIEGVITRRTSVRRGYLPEQGTHANKESLFASVTCFMRLPRRIQRMLLVITIPISCRKAHKHRFLFNLIRRSLEFFRFPRKNRDDLSFCFCFAKVLALALILTIITTSKSSAETWNCGELDKQGNYGNNVQCTLENGVFTVTGNGNMSGYSITTDNWLTTAPWKDYQNQITEIKIANGVTNIGAFAMYDILSVSKITIPSGVISIGQGALAGNKLKSVEIPDTVVRIDVNAFETNLLETINIPDSVKYINGEAFDNNPTLQEIYISDNIDTSNWDISAFDDIRSTPNIICQKKVLVLLKCKNL